ncbi:Uncharacterised protein (plasmid) [Legionella adelaidensis]|uniref:DUF4124 domain-containing protein n=1 Tax=Legionella adelaidensis TaxID=45056 RepID=A0A0W0R470_9GAMM|nr:DUF4124 domain-containing protein [Legionella adelaidensis]KTC65845.1 hypothetical protein Lade_0503 [Legionella adelaidensis]VEH85275.1 Uncharacterised protein [Legionella adelaidensis]
MKKFIGCLALLVTTALRAEIYTWTDSSGVVHFSDKPHVGATEVKLPSVQTFSNPPPAENSAPASSQPEDISVENAVNSEENAYKITIMEPADQATIRNNQGYVPIVISMEPELKKENSLQLIFDNKPVGEPQAATVFSLRDVNRGTHTIAIHALDEEGEVIATSNTVTFFMHRPKIGGG